MHAEKTSEAWSCAVALSKTQTVKDLYTPKGDCKGCGECCARFLPMSQFDLQRLYVYVQKHHIKPHERTAGAIDLTCPYLTDTKECAVYHARPEVCRTYRCDKQVCGESLDFYGSGNARELDMLMVAELYALPPEKIEEVIEREGY